MTFTADLRRFHINTMEKYRKVLRTSAFDLFSAIVLATPVDKGVLRNNWYAEIGRGSTESTNEGEPSGQSAISRIQNRIESADELSTVFLTNNLPYASRIEFDGHSAQAPTGMVRVNLLNWNTIVQVNARRFQNGV